MAKKVNPLAVTPKAIDPTLDALFTTSAGPVTAPPKSRYSARQEQKPPNESNGQDKEEEDDDDEVLSEISEELDYQDEDDERSDTLEADDDDKMKKSDDVEVEMKDGDEKEEESSQTKKNRKRKRRNDNEELEGKYLAELLRKEDSEPSGKRHRGEEEEGESKGQKNEAEDKQDEEDEEERPLHESLTQDSEKSEVEKASRTVFLANVSSEAISSKPAKKELLKHLSSVLNREASPPEKVESLRFRSVAFSTGAMPKRASYITKSLMTATTKSANAYAVFSTAAAARKAVTDLNGTEVLDRHLRVDSVAHPSPMDHRRCVFVGNLGFVDDETVVSTDGDGKTVEKKRNKVPSDVEEGLWRTFGKQGRVENVRVVRDPKTRVGKGFAYVQFYDGNDVEAALLLDGKKFPPMLPRALRVTRAKDPRKTSQALEKARAKADSSSKDASGKSTRYRPKATPEEQAAAGRANKLLGRAGAARHRRGGKPSDAGTSGGSSLKTPHDVIFEGRRASARDGLPKDLKMGKKGKSKGSKMSKPKGRSARRAAAWKQKK